MVTRILRKNKYFFSSVFTCWILLWMLILASCAIREQVLMDRQQKASRLLSCPISQVQIIEPSASWNPKFKAMGCDREAICYYEGPSSVRSFVCEETPESVARTEQKVVVDRLILETGCPFEQVKVVERANWSRGGEAAFRMWACGAFYACTTAPGRTECKPVSSPLNMAPGYSPPVPAMAPGYAPPAVQ